MNYVITTNHVTISPIKRGIALTLAPTLSLENEEIYRKLVELDKAEQKSQQQYQIHRENLIKEYGYLAIIMEEKRSEQELIHKLTSRYGENCARDMIREEKIGGYPAKNYLDLSTSYTTKHFYQDRTMQSDFDFTPYLLCENQ